MTHRENWVSWRRCFKLELKEFWFKISGMDFFNSGLFWFVEGILATVFILGARAWLEDRGIPMTWWKWVIMILWMLGVGAGIAFVGTSLGENEKTAAVKGGVVLGVAAIISGFGLWRLIHRGRSEKGITKK